MINQIAKANHKILSINDLEYSNLQFVSAI